MIYKLYKDGKLKIYHKLFSIKEILLLNNL